MIKLGPENLVAAGIAGAIMIMCYVFMTYMAILALGIAIGATLGHDKSGIVARLTSSLFTRASAEASQLGTHINEKTRSYRGARGASSLAAAVNAVGMLIEELPDETDNGASPRSGRRAARRRLTLPEARSSAAPRHDKPPASVLHELFG